MLATSRRNFLKAGAAALVLPVMGGRAVAAGAAPLDANIVAVGNSLIDQSVDMLQYLRNATARSGATMSYQSIPGAPMKWNWDHAASAETNAGAVLAAGGQDVWIGVESVPFRHVQGRGDACDINAWVDWYRLAYDNGVRHFWLFEAWHDLLSGSPDYKPEDRADPDTGIPWRERLDFAHQFWVGIADHVNNNRPDGAPAMGIIPGGPVFGAIYDDIEAGRAPGGMLSIQDLFIDTIHPNIRGRYAMACTMYACVFGRSPVGLPGQTRNRHGAQYETVPVAEALYFQKKAWEVVQART